MTINIFFLGAPGVGKSTLAHGLMYELNYHHHFSTGFVEESAKGLTWKGNTEQLSNQLYVSATLWENICSLQNKCDVLVCDSHLLVNEIYSSLLYKNVINMVPLYKSIETNSISIIVEPTSDLESNYNQEGRNQDFSSSNFVWSQIQELIIPKLNTENTLRVNRDIHLKDLETQVISKITSIQQKIN